MKKLHNKLVRDKIPVFLQRKGICVDFKYLPISDRYMHLKEKLREETSELLSARDNELLGEICDVYEVLLCIAKEKNIMRKEVEEYRKIKEAERGSFNGSVFLISTDE